MSRTTPVGSTTIHVPTLGALDGYSYNCGVSQFFGIPYGRLSKRWTRSTLATSWENEKHDGTKVGPHYPFPYMEELSTDPSIPVKEDPKFRDHWRADEFNCLNLNIACPAKTAGQGGPYPVMVWIHGGAYWFGGNFHPVFDMFNLVAHSTMLNKPVVVVAINYRLAIGGFLASTAIEQELANDGYSGAGNFALTDQQLALEWVQKYISHFNGDPENVTLFGESAGGISVAHMIAARQPAKFKRAIQQSGSLRLVHNWPLERHQQRFDRLCRYFNIEPSSSDVMDRLRQVPESDLTAATLEHEHSDFTVYNPCDDGSFHAYTPDLSYGDNLPEWLESLMIGDTLHEGELWRKVVAKQDYQTLLTRLELQMSPKEAQRCLELYSVCRDSSKDDLTQGYINIIADMMFKMPNWLIAHRSRVSRTFAYHIDQLSTIENHLKGQAYHAIDLLYVFLNAKEAMSQQQVKLAEQMAGDWVTFANGQNPFEAFSARQHWKLYGPRDKQNESETRSEKQDESVRHYSRWTALLQESLYEKLWNAAEDICYERYRLDVPVTSSASR